MICVYCGYFEAPHPWLDIEHIQGCIIILNSDQLVVYFFVMPYFGYLIEEEDRVWVPGLYEITDCECIAGILSLIVTGVPVMSVTGSAAFYDYYLSR